MSRFFDNSKEMSDKEIEEQAYLDSVSQLELTPNELLQIGFKKVIYNSDVLNPTKIVYEIPCVNGCFYFNQKEKKYTWYHKLVLGSITHYTHLHINGVPELYIVLSSFRVKFNTIIF